MANTSVYKVHFYSGKWADGKGYAIPSFKGARDEAIRVYQDKVQEISVLQEANVVQIDDAGGSGLEIFQVDREGKVYVPYRFCKPGRRWVEGHYDFDAKKAIPDSAEDMPEKSKVRKERKTAPAKKPTTAVESTPPPAKDEKTKEPVPVTGLSDLLPKLSKGKKKSKKELQAIAAKLLAAREEQKAVTVESPPAKPDASEKATAAADAAIELSARKTATRKGSSVVSGKEGKPRDWTCSHCGLLNRAGTHHCSRKTCLKLRKTVPVEAFKDLVTV